MTGSRPLCQLRRGQDQDRALSTSCSGGLQPRPHPWTLGKDQEEKGDAWGGREGGWRGGGRKVHCERLTGHAVVPREKPPPPPASPVLRVRLSGGWQSPVLPEDTATCAWRRWCQAGRAPGATWKHPSCPRPPLSPSPPPRGISEVWGAPGRRHPTAAPRPADTRPTALRDPDPESLRPAEPVRK